MIPLEPHKPLGKFGSQVATRRTLPLPEKVVNEATKIEALSKSILYSKLGLKKYSSISMDEYPKMKNLNNFGRQIVIQMMRSSREYKGFKVDINSHTLKADVLFLVGTLCDDFDYMNTSPLFGCKILDIGCGALSYYAPSDEDDDLLIQFYNDYPPIGAEILQLLGAQVMGIEPRGNDRDKYQYQISYQHKIMEFGDMSSWLAKTNEEFDVITCLNLFNKYSFLYYYNSPKQISEFFRHCRKVISPQGLLYTNAPVLPVSEESRYSNYKIFHAAGFKVLYEGYYYILEPTEQGI